MCVFARMWAVVGICVHTANVLWIHAIHSRVSCVVCRVLSSIVFCWNSRRSGTHGRRINTLRAYTICEVAHWYPVALVAARVRMICSNQSISMYYVLSCVSFIIEAELRWLCCVCVWASLPRNHYTARGNWIGDFSHCVLAVAYAVWNIHTLCMLMCTSCGVRKRIQMRMILWR